MNITIAFMTNYTLDIPNIMKQKQTIESFYNIFKPDKRIEINIFCDENPLSLIEGEFTLFNGDKCNDYKTVGVEYEKKLKEINYLKDAKIIKTKSLCDGYIRAVKMCKTDYLFFLEHDWIFLDNITHTIQELIKFMDNNKDINCILFNKLKNIPTSFQSINFLKKEIPVCLTSRQSNNPNILRISHAKEVRLPLINEEGCSIHKGIHYYNLLGFKLPHKCGGIECELTELCNSKERVKILGTVLYGRKGYKPTIIHSDGCNRNYLNNINKN